jgi:hypothetical protein
MIKKPEPPNLADALRGQEPINKKKLAQKQYEEYILTNLLKEFGTASIEELLFCVVEKYHPKLKIKHQKGVKQQWSKLLGAIIKTEIDARRSGQVTLKAVIHELKKDPIWAPFILNSEEQFRKIYKQKHDAFCCKYAMNCRLSDKEWKELIKSERSKFVQFKK